MLDNRESRLTEEQKNKIIEALKQIKGIEKLLKDTLKGDNKGN
jgi:hypothetical protein